ncbi:MAG TPA: metalloregulator ArsR/SmtB family transcription factor [Gemmatimonadaceae bacterium]|jgi:SAM-dependent methyltransferase|nr:metalloregulator ArsR/SmtB family transcription factor [Gemmatimonadaceae bacterium]
MAAAPRTTVLDRLSVLADPTRSRILLLLDRHELTVGELCTIMQLPQSTVSRHLKLLADDAWLVARGDGTSRFYKMVSTRLDHETKALWSVVRTQMSSSPGATQDSRRAAGVLAKRRDKALIFFRDSAEAWDKMRADMIGARTDLLALLDLLDERWVVGDLGCGAGHISEALAPCVAQVIAVDESGPMLGVATKRLEEHANVDLRVGTIEALPIDDATLDAAVLFLVAHFITDPSKVMHEVRRVLKPGGRLLIVDLMSHDRVDYIVQLGHVWQGFDGEQVKEWLSNAGFTSCRYRPLPADPDAKGPTLFVASARRPSY